MCSFCFCRSFSFPSSFVLFSCQLMNNFNIVCVCVCVCVCVTEHIWLIITLNVNSLNAAIKGHRLAEYIQKQDHHICWLQETHFRSRDTYRLNMRGWKKLFHTNNQKEAGVALLISDKTDFKIDCFDSFWYLAKLIQLCKV